MTLRLMASPLGLAVGCSLRSHARHLAATAVAAWLPVMQRRRCRLCYAVADGLAIGLAVGCKFTASGRCRWWDSRTLGQRPWDPPRNPTHVRGPKSLWPMASPLGLAVGCEFTANGGADGWAAAPLGSALGTHRGTPRTEGVPSRCG